MHLSHLFDFVKIDNKAAFIGVIFFDALSAEHREMVWTVEVLDPLVMLVAEQAVHALLVFEVDVSQDTISLYNLIQDVEVQRNLVYAFQLLDKLAADGTPHPKVMVQYWQALGAECMTAVNKNSWYPFANVELFSAIVAEVQTTIFVISLDQIWILLTSLFFFGLMLFVQTLLLQGIDGVFFTTSFIWEATWSLFSRTLDLLTGRFLLCNIWLHYCLITILK